MIPSGRPGNVPGVVERRCSARHHIAWRTTCAPIARARSGTCAETDRAADGSAGRGVVCYATPDPCANNSADQCAGCRIIGLVDAILRGPAGVGVGITGIGLLLLILI